jgi:hypothetical protein
MLNHTRFACDACGEAYKASLSGLCRACAALAQDVVGRIMASLEADTPMDDESLDALDAVFALAGAYSRAGEIRV